MTTREIEHEKTLVKQAANHDPDIAVIPEEEPTGVMSWIGKEYVYEGSSDKLFGKTVMVTGRNSDENTVTIKRGDIERQVAVWCFPFICKEVWKLTLKTEKYIALDTQEKESFRFM